MTTSKFNYCPECATSIKPAETLDVRAKSYICENNHRFLEYQKHENPKEHSLARNFEISNSKSIDIHCSNDLEIISYWLSQPNARYYLLDQIAHMLQETYWYLTKEKYYKRPSKDFLKLCPICKEELAVIKNGDIYSQAKSCSNNHHFSHRGSTIVYQFDDEIVEITMGMPESTLLSLAQRWAIETRTANYLPETIRMVFKNYCAKAA